MAVKIAPDDAPMARARVGDTRVRIGGAYMCDDARPASLRVAHITESLNITHARARRGGGGVGARSLALAYDGGGDRVR